MKGTTNKFSIDLHHSWSNFALHDTASLIRSDRRLVVLRSLKCHPKMKFAVSSSPTMDYSLDTKLNGSDRWSFYRRRRLTDASLSAWLLYQRRLNGNHFLRRRTALTSRVSCRSRQLFRIPPISVYLYMVSSKRPTVSCVVASICVNPFLTARQHSLLCRALS